MVADWIISSKKKIVLLAHPQQLALAVMMFGVLWVWYQKKNRKICKKREKRT
jgi:hypothetical protein